MITVRARWSALFVLPLLCALNSGPSPGQDTAGQPANMLLDISREFVSAAVAQSIDRSDPVQDVILKTRISGTGHTVAKVGVELIPSDEAAVVDIITTGTTYASTVGVNGPVQIYSDSTVPFQIRQRVYLRPEGILADCPQPRAEEGDTTLTGIGTNFHCLLDRVVRKIASNQYYKKKDQAQGIAAQHAEAQLAESTQAETAPRLREADQKLKKNLAELQSKGIALSSLRFGTSKDTMFVRSLVGPGKGLLPPPPLGERSYLALRMHESLVFEAGQSVAGKTYTGEELEKETRKLKQKDAPMPKDDKDFSITLADKRPLEVAFADGGLSLAVRLSEFTSGEDVYDGMDVTVKYKFQQEADKIKAVRQGAIEAFPPGFKAGQKLSARQTAMRSVLQRRFGKFFKEEMVLQDMELSGDLKKAGPLTATRAVTDRGWLLMTWRGPDK